MSSRHSNRDTARVQWKMVNDQSPYTFYPCPLEPGYHLIPKCRSGLLKYQPKREDLPSRSMKDSFTTAILPISSVSKREHYVNHMGQVRVGSLMEELDMFAGKIIGLSDLPLS